MRFDITRLNFHIRIPGVTIRSEFFLDWIFFVKLHGRNLDYSIGRGRLLVCLALQSGIAVVQGQRNPLTAEMSSEICDKTSLIIIIAQILARILFESIKF